MQSWALGRIGFAAFAGIAASAAPAHADVVLKADSGFIVRIAAEVTASPMEAWREMIAPARWWTAQHTFSGDSANLTLDPVPGGCFCERLPAASPAQAKELPPGQREGGVQHMRVIYVEPLRAMRLTGALGPLQSEALVGTLTMTLKPGVNGTRILWEYVVGGYMRYKPDEISPAVDKMLLGQLTSLASKLGPVAAAPTILAPKVEEGTTGAGAGAGAGAGSDPAAIAKPDQSPGKSAGSEKWSLPPAAPKRAKAAPKAAVAKPAPAALATMPAATGVRKSAARSALKPATASLPAKPARKPAVRPGPKTPSAAEVERREANAAFDAAIGKSAEQ